jgi:site-specific DNA-cytosine methylase
MHRIINQGRIRVLELYCGIGGCAAAMHDKAEVVSAVDIDCDALDVYRTNFPHPTLRRTLESLPAAFFGHANADLWWMSPPCQPYTQRGRHRDLDDPRAQSLKAILQHLAQVRPRYVALENVAGFLNSRAHHFLREVLDRAGYAVNERLLCPTELGAINRRSRFYLVAAQGELRAWPHCRVMSQHISNLLDAAPSPATFVEEGWYERYRSVLHVVTTDAVEQTRCFASSYGKYVVGSGSYLATRDGIRRFTPVEILRQLGFSNGFRLPRELPLRRGWALVGNSLSVHAVRSVLAAIPELSVLGSDV